VIEGSALIDRGAAGLHTDYLNRAAIGEDVRHVAVHGVFAQHQGGGDLGVGPALRDQAEDLVLPRAQGAGAVPRLKRRHAPLARGCPKVGERKTRALELARCGVGAPEGMQRRGQIDARPRGLEWEPGAADQLDAA
jgi:hypothetical protein